MKVFDLIGMREATIIYFVIVALCIISMFSARPTDKPGKGSSGFILVLILITALLAAYLLIRFNLY